MKHKKILKGIRVLVTRPAHQAKALSDMIIEQGGQVILFPVLEIQPVCLDNEISALLNELASIDYVFFISPNAVEYGIAELLKQGKIPQHLKLVTIGKASAQKLQQLIGREADIYPTGKYNSEALLDHQSLSRDEINNKRIIIFRGIGGRELLADTLKQRGAIVNYAEVYQRLKPCIKPQLVDSIWSVAPPDIITISSNESLNNLFEMHTELHDKTYSKQLINTPLIVVTEKMRLNAQALGFNSEIIVAEKAANEALMRGLFSWMGMM